MRFAGLKPHQLGSGELKGPIKNNQLLQAEVAATGSKAHRMGDLL
jgi:hypothetical protein